MKNHAEPCQPAHSGCEADPHAPQDTLQRPSLPLYLALVAKVVHRHVVRRDGHLLADSAAARPRARGSSSSSASSSSEGGSSSGSSSSGSSSSGGSDGSHAHRDRKLEQAFNVERFLPRKASKVRCRSFGPSLFGPVRVQREEVIVKAPKPTEAQVRTFIGHVNDALHPKHRPDDDKAATVITALIYLHRLMAARAVALQSNNWRPLVCAALLSAVKFVCEGWNPCLSLRVTLVDDSPLSVKAVNELEARFLQALRYQLHVSRTEYARMFFALRPLRDVRSKKVPLRFVEAHLGTSPAAEDRVARARREACTAELANVTVASKQEVQRVVRIRARPAQPVGATVAKEAELQSVEPISPRNKKAVVSVKSKLRLRASPGVLALRRRKQMEKAQQREAELPTLNSPSAGEVREERAIELRRRVQLSKKRRELGVLRPPKTAAAPIIRTRSLGAVNMAGEPFQALDGSSGPIFVPTSDTRMKKEAMMSSLAPRPNLFVDIALKAAAGQAELFAAKKLADSGSLATPPCKFLTPSDTTMRGSFDVCDLDSPDGWSSSGYVRDGEYDTLWCETDKEPHHESDAGFDLWGFNSAMRHQHRLISTVT